MYYPWGWSRSLRLPQDSVQDLEQVVCNRDKILTAVLTSDTVLIWYVKPCVPIISHRRSPASMQELGKNTLVQWRPDSAMLVVVTEFGHLIIYHLVVPTDVKTLYELVDPPTPSLRRESNELFVKELIPPLIFSLAFEVEVEGGVADLVAIRDELMIATKSGKILRYSWEGQEIRDYSLDLKRVPFCADQQVLKAVPLSDKGVFVTNIAYSPLIGGYALVLNDGRAAFLVASTLNFDPNSVTGIWAMHLEDANCVALNHKYKLICFGRRNSQGIVYSMDEVTGGLVISHKLVLPTRDYPGCPGPVSCVRWTPDGTAIAMAWERGGFSLWSTFGAMIMCSLCWDYGPNVSDPVSRNPLCIKSFDWSAEGYQLWVVNSKTRSAAEQDPDFMPFPEQLNKSEEKDASFEVLANKAMVFQFLKSPISVNQSTSKQTIIYLQGEDRLFLNLSNIKKKRCGGKIPGSETTSTCPSRTLSESSSLASHVDISEDPSENDKMSLLSCGNKQWTTVTIPHNYIGSSWPIRFTAMDDEGEYIAVAGRTGFAHYCIATRKWRLFGNETQEKDFIVTGGLLWWREFVVMGCYNLTQLRDQIRIYPRTEKLDNNYAKIVNVEAQVLLLNLLDDQLVVFCADSVITIYLLGKELANPGSTLLNVTKVRSYDASFIPGLSFHPACVVLVGLSTLKVGAHRGSTSGTMNSSRDRDSLHRETSPSSPYYGQDLPSIILNICGRVVMIQQQLLDHAHDGRESPSQMSLPTVLASGCETIWFPRGTNPEKPHLTASLWLYCGAHGMRVWLPVFPREGDHGHTFMSKRIMLHFPLEDFYPLAILFEDAIILGAENDTVLYHAESLSTCCLPYSTLHQTSLLFLHPILRQLIRRNLGYHAWEIARTCMTLPYFQHSLELLLHEVLEEEATSTEPIPDALLPSVVDFIQEFPVFHKTIGRCARKTEVALWQHLFSAVGSPRELFLECLHVNDLETAASYLLILQNLEPPSLAQNHATLLLDSALESANWDLAKELVRFLRTIDPEDIDEISPRSHVLMGPQSPPISKANAPEEEISLLLGTLQVPRGRTASISMAASKVPVKDPQKELYRSNSETKPSSGYIRARMPSNSSAKESGDDDQTAEAFYIDVILQRHARKLLTDCRLKDLGTFAAQLDFHMVSWLKRESNRAARMDNFVNSLKRIHGDFAWPFPVLMNNVFPAQMFQQTQRKSSNSSGISSTVIGSSLPASSSSTLVGGLKALKLDLDLVRGRKEGLAALTAGNSDSGYISHANNDVRHLDKDSSTVTLTESLSEQTIHAMLRPLSYREDLSVVSEDVASISAHEDAQRQIESPTSDWSSSYPTPTNGEENILCQEFVSKGPQKSEVQLRYLLQIMMEANCWEIASLISVILKDSLALIRIVNAVRSPPEDKTAVSRIYQNLKALEAWAQSECHGYTPFFHAIQPQLNSLRTFLLSQSKVVCTNTPPRPYYNNPKNTSLPTVGSGNTPGPTSKRISSAPGSARTSPMQNFVHSKIESNNVHQMAHYSGGSGRRKSVEYEKAPKSDMKPSKSFHDASDSKPTAPSTDEDENEFKNCVIS